MEYPPATRDVIEALKAARELDETIWWDRAILALLDLYPTSAIAYALHRPEVWATAFRREFRKKPARDKRAGFLLEELVEASEAAAVSDGSVRLSEAHIARAMREYAGPLLELGIYADPLVDATTARVAPIPAYAIPNRPRVVGAARGDLLAAAVADRSLEDVLDIRESSGTVERKRSIDVHDSLSLAHIEQAAVGLVNGNPDAPVFLVFGQEDDHSVVGEVGWNGNPIDDSKVKACQNRLEQRLHLCKPPLIIKWAPVERDGKRVWIACLLGRAVGTAVQTSTGSYPYRSGDSTLFATPELIGAWMRLPLAPDDGNPIDSLGSSSSEAPNVFSNFVGNIPESSPQDVANRREIILALRANVDEFFISLPPIPQEVRGRDLEAWRPIYEPILSHFRPTIQSAVLFAVAVNDDGLGRLFREIRSVFALKEPRSGITWLTEAPRLICRLIADRVMLSAYMTEQWDRIATIGGPRFDSNIGRVPWVLSTEYAYPETLGRDPAVAHSLVLQEALDDQLPRFRSDATDREIRSAYAAISLALGLCSMARIELGRATGSAAPWVALGRDLWPAFEAWEEEPALVSALAKLAGGTPATFAAELNRRFTGIVQAWIRTSSVPPSTWKVTQRMHDAGARQADEDDMASQIL